MELTSPYDNITPESLKSEILADIAADNQAVDIREGAYTNTVVSGVAYRMYAGYQHMKQLLYAAFPTAESGEFIDRAADSVGMTRKPAEKATVQLTFTGDVGTNVPVGTVCYATESGLRFVTTQEVMLADDSATALAEAVESGAAYNLAAGQINALYVNIDSITGVTNLQAAFGGTDVESDEAFFDRYHQKMTLAPTSNNPDQWILWALEVPGVAFAHCIPVWAGAGTVKVIVAGPDKAPVDDDVVAACQEHLEGKRIISTQVTAVSARHLEVDLIGQIVLGAGYTCDEIQEQLTQLANNMLAQVSFGQETVVPYSKFLACLLQCDGVDDYIQFEVNGTTDGLHIGADETWSAGIVLIEE